MALLLPPKKIRNGAMLLLLQIGRFYLLSDPDAVEIPQVLAGSTQVGRHRVRLSSGVAVLAILYLVIGGIAGFLSPLFARITRFVPRTSVHMGFGAFSNLTGGGGI